MNESSMDRRIALDVLGSVRTPAEWHDAAIRVLAADEARKTYAYALQASGPEWIAKNRFYPVQTAASRRHAIESLSRYYMTAAQVVTWERAYIDAYNAESTPPPAAASTA